MLFLANASSPKVRDAMRAGLIGQMCTPAEGKHPLPGVTWAADNGCFGNGYPGDDRWYAWLTKHAPHRDRCLFAVAPDVVADHAATVERSTPWLPRIRRLGYPAAFVAQNGIEDHLAALDWDAFDVLFLGGDDTFKLGTAGRKTAAEAKRRGKGLHMGRVNSGKRHRLAEALHCDSVDGTTIAIGPDRNVPKVVGWGRADRDQTTLFEIEEAS